MARGRYVRGGGAAGKRLGIVGYGAVGRELATAARALGMEVWATKRSPLFVSAEPLDRLLAATELAELLAECDVVVLCASLNTSTRHLIGAAELDTMKPTAAARERGARRSDRRGRARRRPARRRDSRGAMLDVTTEEPLPPDSPLWTTPNLFITPHISGNTPESWALAGRSSSAGTSGSSWRDRPSGWATSSTTQRRAAEAPALEPGGLGHDLAPDQLDRLEIRVHELMDEDALDARRREHRQALEHLLDGPGDVVGAEVLEVRLDVAVLALPRHLLGGSPPHVGLVRPDDRLRQQRPAERPRDRGRSPRTRPRPVVRAPPRPADRRRRGRTRRPSGPRARPNAVPLRRR